MNTIFIESSEAMGILYNRYSNIPDKIDKFLDAVDRAIKMGDKDKVPGEDDIGLDEKLADFKKSIDIDMRNPEPIDGKDIKKIKKNVQEVKDRAIKSLEHLGRMRHTFRYGDNAIKGVIIKPKVYQNTTDDDKLASVNKFMRITGRCMDWAEKFTLDLMNLADQDLNILTLVSKVYFRTLFESELNDINDTADDIMMEDIVDLCTDEYDPYVEGSGVEEDDDIMKDRIHNSNEKYYPVFSVVYSYDFDKYQNANADQKACIKRGKAISAFTKGDQYTHTLVSFDTSFENMFHFIGNGFNSDSIYTNPATEVTKSIYVNVSFVTREERDIIMDQVNNHKAFKDDTGYSIKILIDQFLGKSNHIDKRQICSTFVAYLLACGNIKNLPRDYSLIRPEDITILPRAFYVMTFKDRDDFRKRNKEFKDKVDQIYKDNIEEIREYNNILPRVVIRDKFKQLGAIDKVVDWFAKKKVKESKGEKPE